MLTSRIARRSDYRKVARLCRRSVGPRDYVLSELEEVIDDGRLFLAFEGKKLVGISHLTELPDNSGWLGMARTDPDWRGKGVAQFLQRKIAAYEKERGIKRLRMFILETNTSSIRAVQKGGFKPVCDVSYLSRRVKRTAKIQPITSNRPSIQSLPKSQYVRMLNGYFGYGWQILRASQDVFKKIVDKDGIYMGRGTTILFTNVKESQDNLQAFTLLDGPVGKGLKQAIEIGSQIGCKDVGTFLPYEPRAIKTAKKLGFSQSSWGWHMIVFEKKI